MIHACSTECFYCPKCKQTVVHQEDNPDDSEHCFCRRNQTFGVCSCRCHNPSSIELPVEPASAGGQKVEEGAMP